MVIIGIALQYLEFISFFAFRKKTDQLFLILTEAASNLYPIGTIIIIRNNELVSWVDTQINKLDLAVFNCLIGRNQMIHFF